jgi:hypothetical protein
MILALSLINEGRRNIENVEVKQTVCRVIADHNPDLVSVYVMLLIHEIIANENQMMGTR